jgi:hypothetical protein
MNLKKWLIPIFVISISIFIVSCNSQELNKQLAMQSLTQQSSMLSYQFQGKATLQLSPTFVGFQSPLAQELFAFVSSSTLTWKGVTRLQPLHMDMELNITPDGAEDATYIPFLLENNQLFVQLPKINKPNEFMLMDSLPAADSTSSVVPYEQLSKAPEVLTNLISLLVSHSDEKWFTVESQAATTTQTAKRIIHLEVTEKTKAAFNEMIQEQLPDMASLLQVSGIMTSTQANAFDQLKKIEIQLPSVITIEIDESGYVIEQYMDMYMKLPASSQPDVEYRFSVHQSYTEINKPLENIKPAPEKYILWSDIIAKLQ